jgi:hypothetical protein
VPNASRHHYDIKFNPEQDGGVVVMEFTEAGKSDAVELTLGASDFLVFVMQCRGIAESVSAHVEPQD